jgi:hypothetical protein
MSWRSTYKTRESAAHFTGFYTPLINAFLFIIHCDCYINTCLSTYIKLVLRLVSVVGFTEFELKNRVREQGITVSICLVKYVGDELQCMSYVLQVGRLLKEP